MIHRLLAVLVLVIFLGTCAYSQDAVEPSRLTEAPAAAETATPAQPEAQIPRAPANGNASPAASPSTKSSSPRIIIIVESTTEMERSEVIRKAVDALEKDGFAMKVPMNESFARPLDFHASISTKPDVSWESLQQVVKTLKNLGVQRVTLGIAQPDSNNNIIVSCLPDVPWRKVRELQEALAAHREFKLDVRVAANDGPVTPTRAVPNEQPPEPATESSRPGDSPVPIADRAQVAQQRNETIRRLRDSSLESIGGDSETIAAFHLRFAPAKETARIIEQLTAHAAKRPSLVADERTNSIIVRGNIAAIQEVEQLLKVLEVADPKAADPANDSPTTLPALQSKGSGDEAQSYFGQAAVCSVAELRERLRQRFEDLEQQCRDLAGKLKQPLSSPAEGARLNDLLRKTVHLAFEARQELQRVELAEFTKRLQGLQQSLELRQTIADKIIERRIEELLDPNLNWEAIPTDQSAVHEFRAGDTPLWNEFGVTPKPVTPLTAKVLEWIGLHLAPITKERFREKNVLTKYEGGLDVGFVGTGGPAEKAGIHEKDIVVGLQERPLLTLAELDAAMQMAVAQVERKDANALSFDVLRNGETVKLNVLFPAGIVDPFTNDANPHLTPPAAQSVDPERGLFGKTPDELHDLLVSRTKQVEQIQESCRRWEQKRIEGHDAAEIAEAKQAIARLWNQLEEHQRKLALAQQMLSSQIMLLEAESQQNRTRLEITTEAWQRAKKLNESKVIPAQEVQAAYLKCLEADLATIRTEAALKLYRQAGEGLAPNAEVPSPDASNGKATSTAAPKAGAGSRTGQQSTEANPPFDKSALPKVTDNYDYRPQTTFLNGLASDGGIIERIDGDTIHLRSGDHFVVPEGTMVQQPMTGRRFATYPTNVLEPGMAIGYSIRDGKLERLILTGIVSGKSVFDTIKELKLRKGGEVNDEIDGRNPIRLTGKNGEVSIRMGETQLIELPKPTKAIEWRAGDFKPEVIDDSESFDYVLVQWRDNGRITWTCYASPAIPLAGTNETDATAQEPAVRSLPFEFRLAQFEAADGFDEFTVPGSEQKIYISREPLAMIFDVAAARVIDDANGKPAVEISYSPVAAKRMTELTEQHLNKPLAIFVDGKLLSAPTIRQSFGSPALITGQFTREEAERIANGINRKLESLNTTIETLNSVSDGDPTPAGDVSTSDTTKELSGETPQ